MSFLDTLHNDDITTYELEKWTCDLYEQFGWITLATKTNNNDKVKTYFLSIKKLKKYIESRLSIVTSEDVKLNLTNLLSQVEHLLQITLSLLNKENIICNKCNSNINDKISNENKFGGSKIKHLNELSKLSKKNSKKTSKITHLNELSKLSKKNSKKNSKKLSKKTSKKLSKKIPKELLNMNSKIISKKYK